MAGIEAQPVSIYGDAGIQLKPVALIGAPALSTGNILAQVYHHPQSTVLS